MSAILLSCDYDAVFLAIFTKARLVLQPELSFFSNLSRKYCCDADIVAIKCVHIFACVCEMQLRLCVDVLFDAFELFFKFLAKSCSFSI